MPVVITFEADLYSLSLVVCAFLLAGAVKGLVGLGMPPTAMGVLVLAMTPVEAAALTVVPSIAANLWQAIAGPNFVSLLRRFWPMLVAGPAVTLAGTGWLANGDPRLAMLILGLMLAFYGLITLMRPDIFISRPLTRWLNPVVGLLTGAATAATGVSTVPVAPYLQALDLEPGELVQALGLFFSSVSLALAINLTLSGALTASSVWMVGLALVSSGIGMALGTALRGRIDPVVFRRVFLMALFVLGAFLVIRAL